MEVADFCKLGSGESTNGSMWSRTGEKDREGSEKVVWIA